MGYLQDATHGISVLGMVVIVLGVVCALVRFVHSEFSAVRGKEVDDDRRRLRETFGYYLLLGLEFLIAADVIETLMTPTTQELIVLGSVVAIRTVISHSLNSEVGKEPSSRRREVVTCRSRAKGATS